MSESEETIYSTMFKSLKHPVRRKILRILSDKPMGFSEMLDGLGVSSSHLTYHLESLGELVAKVDGGNYKLSTFGEAAVNTMRIVEDAPVVQSQQRWSMSFRWKPVFAALAIAIVLLASFAVVQFNSLNQMSISLNDLQDSYNQLLSQPGTAITNRAMSFLRDVIQFDLTKYDMELLSNKVENPPELNGMAEQTLTYSLTSSDSKMTIVFVFDNDALSKYQLSLTSGLPIYNSSQPFIVLDSAKWLIQKMTFYEDESYLNDMNRTLYQVPDATTTIQITEGTLKFNMSISGGNGAMQWYYSENGVDFTAKGLKLKFEDQVLTELDDSYFLYTIGNTQVNVDQAEAIQAAKNAVKSYSLTSGGQTVSSYEVLDQPVGVVFDPTPREDPLALVPHWTVTLYLDNMPAGYNINRLSVGVWADNGKTEPVRALSG